MTTDERPARDVQLLMHLLASIAYRTQKAVRDAPADYWEFDPGHRARTPIRILRHMTSLMGYACTYWDGGSYPIEPEPLDGPGQEVARFHAMLEQLGERISSGLVGGLSTEQLVQGPLADTLTHVGQLAYLRRLAESPVAPENFIHAEVRADHLGPDQAPPAAPDAEWPDAPAGDADEPSVSSSSND